MQLKNRVKLCCCRHALAAWPDELRSGQVFLENLPTKRNKTLKNETLKRKKTSFRNRNNSASIPVFDTPGASQI